MTNIKFLIELLYFSDKKLVLLSDSLSALTALQKHSSYNRILQRIFTLHYFDHSSTFVLKYNEAVDIVAEVSNFPKISRPSYSTLLDLIFYDKLFSWKNAVSLITKSDLLNHAST